MLVSERLEGIYKFHGNNITCELPEWALRIPCPSNAWTTIIVKDAFFFQSRHKHIAQSSFKYTNNYLHAHNPKREKEYKFDEVNDVKINKSNQGKRNDHN